MSGRRLDVTPTQAVSSMMAALTGAIAASRLGIAGTIVGAAFMSLASTVGAAVYKHYLARSNERLRAAAAKASTNAVAGAVLRHHLHLDPGDTAHLRPDGQAVVETSEAGATRPGPHARPDDPAGAGAAFGRDDAAAGAVAADIAAALRGDHTTLGHASLGYTAAEHPATGAGRDGSTTAGLRPAADLAETVDLGPAPRRRGSADPRPAGRLRDAAGPGYAVDAGRLRDAAGPGNAVDAGRLRDAAGPGNAVDADGAGWLQPAGRGSGSRSGRSRWLRLSAAVLGVFVVAMGAVTGVEAIAGKPLETLIWHRSGSGTTVGSVVSPPRQHPATVPGNAPARSKSPSAQPSSTSPGVVSPTPTPTPSLSVAPSQGATTAPGTGASSGTGTPGTGTSPGTGTQAPGTTPAGGQ